MLTDSGDPRRPASESNIRIYAPELCDGTGWSLCAGPVDGGLVTNPPGDPDPFWTTVAADMTIDHPGWYVHLASAKDNHAANDKGHRQRWALPRGVAVFHPLAYNFQTYIHPLRADQESLRHQKWLADGTAYAARGEYSPAISMYHVAFALEEAHLFTLYGHGNPGVFCTNQGDWSPDFTMYARRASPDEEGLFLEDLVLSRQLLVVFYTCLSAAADPDPVRGSVIDQAVLSGARCAVGFTTIVYFGVDYQGKAVHTFWADRFWQALCAGQDDENYFPDGTPENAERALQWAAEQVRRHWGAYWYTNKYEVAGDRSIVVTPAR